MSAFWYVLSRQKREWRGSIVRGFYFMDQKPLVKMFFVTSNSSKEISYRVRRSERCKRSLWFLRQFFTISDTHFPNFTGIKKAKFFEN